MQWSSLIVVKFQMKVRTILLYTTLWSLWLYHNKVLFEGNHRDLDAVLVLILARFAVWFKAIIEDFNYTGLKLFCSLEAISY